MSQYLVTASSHGTVMHADIFWSKQAAYAYIWYTEYKGMAADDPVSCDLLVPGDFGKYIPLPEWREDFAERAYTDDLLDLVADTYPDVYNVW